ncbi:sensor histidine kinase, partial [Streptomyces broussonetiae]|uniref:sensor histidine kinase n=1 Tax=Streptomyces broussonetiae TaxID=2686304 RepID=UPI0035E0678F
PSGGCARSARAATRGSASACPSSGPWPERTAVRYNVPEDGWVEVATEVEHGQAVLTVSNTGPVVPAYEIDNLFEPFRRLRTERTGSDKGVGLGLSIVRSVARAHGGHIVARPREGGGLVMRVTLPL